MSEETPQTENQAPEAGITINDIHAATQIIDAASRRGAFGASEAATVGAVYERLVSFLQQVAPELFQQPQEESQEEAKDE